MGATLIVEHEMLADAGSRIADGVIGVQIDFLVLDRLPKPFDEDIVSPAALAVHADPDVAILEHLSKLGAGELAALVGIEDLGCAEAGKGFLQGVDAEIGAHADRHAPGEYPPARPVHDCCEIDEPTGHGHVGDIHRPHMIGAFDGQLPEQVRIDRVSGIAPRGIGFLVQSLDAHRPHQGRDVLATDEMAFAFEKVAHHAAARERVLKMQLINAAHQSQILARGGPGQVVDR